MQTHRLKLDEAPQAYRMFSRQVGRVHQGADEAIASRSATMLNKGRLADSVKEKDRRVKHPYGGYASRGQSSEVSASLVNG